MQASHNSSEIEPSEYSWANWTTTPFPREKSSLQDALGVIDDGPPDNNADFMAPDGALVLARLTKATKDMITAREAQEDPKEAAAEAKATATGAAPKSQRVAVPKKHNPQLAGGWS